MFKICKSGIAFIGKEIAVLCNSVDENKASWLKTVRSENTQGTHVWVQGTENNISKAYGINGIPHYYLIDKQGRILSSNAERPSSKSIQQNPDAALN
ncbi:MAG: hypothetical protein WC760_05705 [Bacteroidia bacterium]|jgi:hypothetical protein